LPIVFLLAFFAKKILGIYFAILILVFYLFSAWGMVNLDAKSDLKAGTEINSMGRILSIQKTDEGYVKLFVKTPGEKILLSISGNLPVDNNDLVGRKLRFAGLAETPRAKSNPNMFDYALWLKTKGIRIIVKAKANEVDFVDTNFFNNPVGELENKIAGYKFLFLDRLKESVSADNFSVLNGIMFGDKDEIPEETLDDFSKNGASHVLTTSGLHIGIIYLAVFAVLGKKRNLKTSIFIIVFLVVYAFFAEFSAPVVRAVLMITVHIFGLLIKRDFDLFSAVSAAGLLVLAWNPLQLLSASFILSYIAILSIACGSSFVSRKIGSDSGLLNFVAIILIIQIGMIPVLAYAFNILSFSAFFMNIPVILIAEIILPIGLVLLLLKSLAFIPVFSGLFDLLSEAENILLNILRELLALSAKQKMFNMSVVSPNFVLIILFYVLIFFLTSELFLMLFLKRRKKILGIFCLAILFFAFAIFIPNKFDKDNSDLVFVDVGQGDCLHVRTPSGKNLLFDGGGKEDYNIGKKVLKPYLLKNGVSKIDYAFASHMHTDHYKGLLELKEEGMIKNLLTNKDLKNQKIKIDKGVSIEVFSAGEYDPKTDDENKNSKLFNISYNGVKTLMTGDIGFEGEEILLAKKDGAQKINTDILKIGHHGSKTSTSDEFLKAASPIIAVIQVGQNTYGHPTSEVLEKLKKIPVHRNDLNGAILIDIDKGKLKIKTMID
jgi:competence protein ComEC